MAGLGLAIRGKRYRVDSRVAPGIMAQGVHLAVIVPHIAPPRRVPAPLAAPRLPPVIGHRGAAGRAPENTLAGLRKAKELGCLWVEFDARLTADGVPVLCHDARLERTTNGAGLISALPFSAVRDCDAGIRFGPEFTGESVPTLTEALLLCAALGLAANIELKADHGRHYATGAAVAADLKQLAGRLPPLLVSSFHPWALTAFARACDAPLGALFRLVPRRRQELAQDHGVIGADHRRLTRRQVGRIRDAGHQLAAFTVNDPARARQLYAWGVTSVFSDVPDIILAAAAGARPARRSVGVPRGRRAAQQGTNR
jgi:glycerophosphoryl diester phosphodiesterase